MQEFFSSILKRREQGRSIVAGSTNVRYGKQEDAKILFDTICQTKDPQKKKELIDDFIVKMEAGCEKNGFFKSDEAIYLNEGQLGQTMESPCFKIDDKNLYYLFFDTFEKLKSINPNERDSVIHKKAVIATVNAYFGQYNGDPSVREKLASTSVDWEKFEEESYEPEITSISVFRNKNCAMCVERATVSHNLWLLGGYESYCVTASSIKFQEHSDEAHCYCLVNYNNRFKLFDPALGKYKAFEENDNVAEKILNGKPLIIDGDVYANLFNMPKTENII